MVMSFTNERIVRRSCSESSSLCGPATSMSHAQMATMIAHMLVAKLVRADDSVFAPANMRCTPT